MSGSLEKEFLDFLEKKGGDKRSNDGKDPLSQGSSSHGGGGGGSSDRRRGDPLSKSSSHGGPKNRRSLMTKSLSKEDLNVEPVKDFFAEFEEEEGFPVDWDDPAGQEEGAEATERRKAHLARSRRLGPGDRRKEIMRRNSSRRLLGDSSHGGDNPRSRSSSIDGDEDGGFNRRGLNRRASNRSLMSSGSHEKQENQRDMFAEFEKKASQRNLLPAEDAAEPTAPSNKTTVRSLKEDLKEGFNDMEMSFSEMPKEWQVSSNPAVASFLPSQRAPNRSKSGSNPRHNHSRRNSLNGAISRPQMQRRLSSRGGAMMKEDGGALGSDQRRSSRRHSLMGDTPNSGEGMHRQRSTRGLSADDGNEPQASRRTTTVPRRMSTGGNTASCRDLGVGRRPATTNINLTGETIAAMGGATIRW